MIIKWIDYTLYIFTVTFNQFNAFLWKYDIILGSFLLKFFIFDKCKW